VPDLQRGASYGALPRCSAPAAAADKTRDASVVASTSILAATAQIFGDIFLKTATVLIDAPSGPRRAICFVDDGSHRSFIRRELAEDLGLPVEDEEELAIGPFGKKTAGPAEVLQRRPVKIRGTFPNAKAINLQLLDKEVIQTIPPYGRISQTTFGIADIVWPMTGFLKVGLRHLKLTSS
jgi:hypothetical protein